MRKKLRREAPVPGKKTRLAAAVAAAGACVLLAACSPVKMGAAAIVGSDRITSTSLDTEVSNLQAAATKYGSAVPVTPAQMPKDVLGWLITFDIRDRMAKDAGVSVSQADIDSARANLNHQAQASAQQNSQPYGGFDEALAQLGMPPNLANAFARWYAQELAFIKKNNGNKLPTAQTAVSQAIAQVQAADCKASKALNIQVNPQYGQLSYNSTSAPQYAVIAGNDTLSRSAGATSPAAMPIQPAC